MTPAVERIGVPAPVARRIRVSSFDEFSRTQLESIEPPGVRRYARAEQLRPHVLDAITAVQSNPHERHPLEHVIQGSGEGLVEGLLNSFALLKGTLALTGDDGEPLHPTPGLAEELGHDYTPLCIFKAFEQLRRHGERDRSVPRDEGRWRRQQGACRARPATWHRIGTRRSRWWLAPAAPTPTRASSMRCWVEAKGRPEADRRAHSQEPMSLCCCAALTSRSGWKTTCWTKAWTACPQVSSRT